MARRPERTPDSGPAIEVEPAGAAAGTVTEITAIIELKAPGEDVALRLLDSTRRAQHRYSARIGNHKSFDPRTQSLVQHRVSWPVESVLDALHRSPAAAWSARGVAVVADASAPAYDAVNHEHRIPARLHLDWSWPDLPVWLAIGELSPTRCTLRLSLRTRKRWRYPARYFDAAHAALTGLESSLSPASDR